MEAEVGRLRESLEVETMRCLEIQRRLDRAGADFEEFVSRAAHNLRESLREIASLTQLLGETHADRLDSEGGLFLNRIQVGTAAAQSLLTDVVDYWATVAGERQFFRTDLEAVLGQAILITNRQITEQSAIVTHDPLPVVMGNFEVLTKVLHHLIRNAIEYCDTPPPRIHISLRREGAECIFSVQDKGPGIDPAFTGRLFGAFKRLHGNEHPGNGLGLAFCKKAIEWQGGQMWMESTLGVGSTFYFSVTLAN